MNFTWPIAGIGKLPGIYISQNFGNVWITDRDMVIAGISLKTGDNVYQRAFNMLGHNGLDITAPLGTPIVAIADGFLVERLSKPTNYGLRITQEIDLGDKKLWATYGHFDRFAVDQEFSFYTKKVPISRGDIIGYVDSTGFSTGDHLHLSVYELDKNLSKLFPNNGYSGAVDPLKYFKDEPNMIVYKKTGEATLYFAVGNVLIPFATDYASYLKEFGQAVVVELPVGEFIKFKVASELKVKK